MTPRSSYQDINPLNSLFSVLIMIGIFVGMFYAFNFIFKILAWASPVVLLVTLLLDYQVIFKYFRLMAAFTRRNLGAGILFIALSVLFFPVISLFLLGKAIFNKRVDSISQKMEAENNTYTPFEEIDDEPIINSSRQKSQETKYDYHKLFGDV